MKPIVLPTRLRHIETWKIPKTILCYDIKYIKQRDGSTRVLEIPSPELYRVQRIISRYFTKCINSKYNIAFQRGWNYFDAIIRIADNVNQISRDALEPPILYKVDIKEFFQTTRPNMLVDELLIRGFKPKLINKIVTLCFYNNHLPTGAPSSPILSSIASEHLDRRLFSAIMNYTVNYSRYADDYFFLFDSEEKFHKAIPIINYIIRDYGYNINTDKTKKITIKSHFKMMGIVGSIQDGLQISLPRKRRSQILSEFKTMDKSRRQGYLAWLTSIEKMTSGSDLELSSGMSRFLEKLKRMA